MWRVNVGQGPLSGLAAFSLQRDLLIGERLPLRGEYCAIGRTGGKPCWKGPQGRRAGPALRVGDLNALGDELECAAPAGFGEVAAGVS